MNVGEGDFRRRYAELSDDALLSIDREELIEVASQCLDEELARRGLSVAQKISEEFKPIEDESVEFEISEEPATTDDELVCAATFLFPDEAEVARGLLRSAGILCYLENEHALNAVWPWSNCLGGLRLMVRASLLEEVREILYQEFAEEEFAVQAGPYVDSTEEQDSTGKKLGRNGGRVRMALALGILFSPSVEYLRILYVWR